MQHLQQRLNQQRYQQQQLEQQYQMLQQLQMQDRLFPRPYGGGGSNTGHPAVNDAARQTLSLSNFVSALDESGCYLNDVGNLSCRTCDVICPTSLIDNPHLYGKLVFDGNYWGKHLFLAYRLS